MRKVMFLLLSLASALGLSLVSTAPAQAIGGESLACHFTNPTWASPCQASVPAGSYTAVYKVINTSGSYTYAWTPPQTPSGGCGSTDDYCAVPVYSAGGSDLTFTALVTITQAGRSASLSVAAVVPATCHSPGWYFWC